MLQFKKYGIKELEVMADMIPMKGDPAIKAKQKALFWTTYLLTAGLMGIHALDALDKWSFTGVKNHVTEFVMKRAGSTPLGRGVGKALLYGILAPTLNIDVSNRARLKDWKSRTRCWRMRKRRRHRHGWNAPWAGAARKRRRQGRMTTSTAFPDRPRQRSAV